MPAADPLDQQAARMIEAELRLAVARQERPPVDLEWFVALPKRTRRSGELLRAALAEPNPLLEYARASWARARESERERASWFAQTQARPRDLECLRAPSSAAWNGLGRRKARCRKFEVVGRAYLTRKRVSDPVSTSLGAPDPPLSPQPVETLAVAARRPRAAVRPVTPPGLREAVVSALGLPPVAHGLATPIPPTPVPVPPTKPCIPPPRYPDHPQPKELKVEGCQVSRDIAYIVAHGRYMVAPGLLAYSLRDAAVDILETDRVVPGVLVRLAGLLCPHGVDEDRMVLRTRCLMDFCRGWYDLAG